MGLLLVGLGTVRLSEHKIEGLADTADLLGASAAARLASRVSAPNRELCRRPGIEVWRRDGLLVLFGSSCSAFRTAEIGPRARNRSGIAR